MSGVDELFSSDDEPAFITWVTQHLEKGAATRRGMTPRQYVDLARGRWGMCEADKVYALKLFIDPLTQPELAAEVPSQWTADGLPFCELVARIDSKGDLVDAPPGYAPPAGVMLAHIVAGSPTGGEVPDPAVPGEYLIAFLDVLGFEALLQRIGLDELARRYEELLKTALKPHSEERPWSLSLALVAGEPTPGLMWLPIQTAYFSDSLLLWVAYHPGHVHEFLDRCSRVFCAALAQGLPVRGAIAVGRALLDKERGIFLGEPLIEAVRLESKLNWIGIALGTSWKSETQRIPVPPDKVFLYQPPLKEGGASLFGDLVLDWPRAWRESHQDSAADHLRALADPRLPEELRERYAAAIRFWDYSEANRDWFVPPGAVVMTARNPSGRETGQP
jgi:hypothetical protein